MQSYLDRLDEELSKQPGFKKPSAIRIKKRRTTSKTDPDSGCINHGKKSGIGYLIEATVDCKHGIITGIDVYPANETESLLVLRYLERQIKNGVPMRNIALNRGYDTGAVHRGLELLGITGYIPAIQFSNSPEKYGFYYLPPRRCVLLSGRCQACLPTVELQQDNRKIFTMLSGTRRYLQAL